MIQTSHPSLRPRKAVDYLAMTVTPDEENLSSSVETTRTSSSNKNVGSTTEISGDTVNSKSAQYFTDADITGREKCLWARDAQGEVDFADALDKKHFVQSEARTILAKDLTINWLRKHGLDFPLYIPSKENLGIQVPGNGFSVRDVVNLVGPRRPVDVIEVANQAELRNWRLADWGEYYSDPEIRSKILNVISLEFSATNLQAFVRSPDIVRKLDWIDNVWPGSRRANEQYPRVQYYCLMSLGGSYTDFHVDFGGTSVWYHVLRGRKVFFFAPPTQYNLKKYEEWTSNPDQASIFFGDECERCFRVELQAGNTLIIPAGWIHAVYTPDDSLVFGGNFLHNFGAGTQLRCYNIEKATKVPRKFRFPFFEHIQWYAAAFSLQFLRHSKFNELYRCANGCYPELFDRTATDASFDKLAHENKHTDELEHLEQAVGIGARELMGLRGLPDALFTLYNEYEDAKKAAAHRQAVAAANQPRLKLVVPSRRSRQPNSKSGNNSQANGTDELNWWREKSKGKVKGALKEPDMFSPAEAAEEASRMVGLQQPIDLIHELRDRLNQAEETIRSHQIQKSHSELATSDSKNQNMSRQTKMDSKTSNGTTDDSKPTQDQLEPSEGQLGPSEGQSGPSDNQINQSDDIPNSSESVKQEEQTNQHSSNSHDLEADATAAMLGLAQSEVAPPISPADDKHSKSDSKNTSGTHVPSQTGINSKLMEKYPLIDVSQFGIQEESRSVRDRTEERIRNNYQYVAHQNNNQNNTLHPILTQERRIKLGLEESIAPVEDEEWDSPNHAEVEEEEESDLEFDNTPEENISDDMYSTDEEDEEDEELIHVWGDEMKTKTKRTRTKDSQVPSKRIKLNTGPNAQAPVISLRVGNSTQSTNGHSRGRGRGRGGNSGRGRGGSTGSNAGPASLGGSFGSSGPNSTINGRGGAARRGKSAISLIRARIRNSKKGFR